MLLSIIWYELLLYIILVVTMLLLLLLLLLLIITTIIMILLLIKVIINWVSTTQEHLFDRSPPLSLQNVYISMHASLLAVHASILHSSLRGAYDDGRYGRARAMSTVLHPVSVRRFPSFRTQPLENLSRYLWEKGLLSNPAPGEHLPSGNLVMETGCSGACGASRRRRHGRISRASVRVSHFPNATCPKQVLFKVGEQCSNLRWSLTRRNTN